MTLTEPLRAAIARRLELGAPPTAVGRALAAVWGARSEGHVRRRLRLPEGVPVVGIGGAVLGGAGKTPVAIALARELARRGARPVLVGHAFRAAPGRARLVLPDDAVGLVGDDALCAARLLAPHAIPVVVATSRQSAIYLAARVGDVVVVDGLLQSRPAPLRDAILVLDASAPWGADACPPLGDLRAPREALLASADHLAFVGDDAAAGAAAAGGDRRAVAIVASATATVDSVGRRAPLGALCEARVGLAIAVARPGRIERTLADAGIVPSVRVLLSDHASFDAELAVLRRAQVDVWLTTGRCATKLPRAIGRAPVLALERALDVAPLVDRLRAAAG